MNEAIKLENFIFHENKHKKEIIDGRIYLMASPCDEHIDVQYNICRIFNEYFELNKKKCRARQDSQLNIDEKNYFEPDIKILCRDCESSNGNIPVIVIEILSKSTRNRDLGIKMKKYAELGIKEYWIVDWNNLSIDIYLLNDAHIYNFYHSYALFVESDRLDRLDEDEKKEVISEFFTVSFPDLKVHLEKVFDIFE